MSKNYYDLHVTCKMHQRPLEGGQPQLFRKAGRGKYVINLFPHMHCPGMWDGDNELTDQICWDYWVAEVEIDVRE
jgi:hypothetical protein